MVSRGSTRSQDAEVTSGCEPSDMDAEKLIWVFYENCVCP